MKRRFRSISRGLLSTHGLRPMYRLLLRVLIASELMKARAEPLGSGEDVNLLVKENVLPWSLNLKSSRK